MAHENFPHHVAIIMDGNGRWALAQGKKRTYGHFVGSQVVDKITRVCAKIGIEYLTLYAFSTENWKRPPSEVRFLMSLLNTHLRKQEHLLNENRIRFNVIGDLSSFSPKTKSIIQRLMEKTLNHDRMCLTLALNYGSKMEITTACKRIAQKVKDGLLQPEEITQKTVSEHLFSHDLPDVDLLIRTGGEKRISNFMLWQCSYAEFVFMDKYWPDFDEKDLIAAIDEFKHRKRRFGGL